MMDDNEFEALKLRASLAPRREEWPSEQLHWQFLGKCIDDLRAHVSASYALMNAVEHDSSLSSKGKRQQKAAIAQDAIAELHAPNNKLERARQSGAPVQTRFQNKIDEIVKQPKDAAEAALYREIRDKFSKLKDASARMSFLQRHGGDAEIASALLAAPAGLTELSESERTLLQGKVEGKVDAEVVAARDAMAKAIQQAEEAWARAQKLIANRAGLGKSSDGSWSDAA